MDLVTDSKSIFADRPSQILPDRWQSVTVVAMMHNNMLHYASIILAILVWMTENIAAVQKLDRQQECNDGVGCGFVATFMSCDIIEARCPETCGKCVGEEAACEDAEHCGLLFEHPEVTGVSYFLFILCMFSTLTMCSYSLSPILSKKCVIRNMMVRV